MPIGVAAGYTQKSYNNSAGLEQIIPLLFYTETKKLYRDELLMNQITNHDYVGGLNESGDEVTIPSTPVINNFDYVKGMEMPMTSTVHPAPTTFKVNKAKAWFTFMDHIDIRQSHIKDWLPRYAEAAKVDLKTTIETDFLGSIFTEAHVQNKGLTAGRKSGNISLGTIAAPFAVTATNIITQGVLKMNQVMDEQNAPRDGGRYVVGPAWFTQMLKASLINKANEMGDEKSVIRSGYVGTIDQTHIYMSNLTAKEAGVNKWHIIFGHKAAITHVDNLSKVVMLSPERYFADAIKGLLVYDWKSLQPTLLGEMVVAET